MRRSQFTENEILHLLDEAGSGISAAEICRTAGVSLRTFYRWRHRYGGLNAPAVMKMKELTAENRRLRGLVHDLVDRLRAPAVNEPPQPAPPAISAASDEKTRNQTKASRIAAEKCGGALTGRFASLRVHP